MPFWAPSPDYYYPNWSDSNHVEINFKDYKLYGYTNKPITHVKPEDIIILYFHGNAGNIYFRIPQFINMINKLKSNKHNTNSESQYVLAAFDYRGFGLSNGTPTYEGILEDGVQMANWARVHFPKNKIVYYGESIGTSVVAYISQFTHPNGIILKSPFASMASLVADMFHIPYIIPQCIL